MRYSCGIFLINPIARERAEVIEATLLSIICLAALTLTSPSDWPSSVALSAFRSSLSVCSPFF